MGGVYLHIGLGKTGTTAIQFWLDANREPLATHGWHYPKIGFFERGRAHHAIAHKWGGWIAPKLLAGRDLDQEWRQLADTIRSSDGSFIVSSENFATVARRNSTVVPFIAETLRGIETRIVLYLRQHDDLAEAVYRQSVKAGLTLQTPRKFIKALPPEFDFKAVIADWSSHFENVFVSWYNPSDVVSDFRALVGIPEDPQFTAADRPNQRITKPAVRAILSEKATTKARIREIIETHQSKDGALLSPSQREAIRQRYSQSNP